MLAGDSSLSRTLKSVVDSLSDGFFADWGQHDAHELYLGIEMQLDAEAALLSKQLEQSFVSPLMLAQRFELKSTCVCAKCGTRGDPVTEMQMCMSVPLGSTPTNTHQAVCRHLTQEPLHLDDGGWDCPKCRCLVDALREHEPVSQSPPHFLVHLKRGQRHGNASFKLPTACTALGDGSWVPLTLKQFPLQTSAVTAKKMILRRKAAGWDLRA